MGKKLYIIEENCIGCGMCETTSPEVFKVVDGVSTVLMVEGWPEKLIEAAKLHCLNSAIQWTEK